MLTSDVFSLASTLHATVWDHDNVGSPSFMGKVYLPVAPIYNAAKGIYLLLYRSFSFGSDVELEGVITNWYLLGPEKGTKKEKAKISGQILLEISYQEIAPQVLYDTLAVMLINHFFRFLTLLNLEKMLCLIW